MPKILRVNPYEIVVGMDDGSMRNFSRSECNYNPRPNDLVDIFESDFETLITKREINCNNSNTYVYRENISGRYVDKVVYVVLSFLLGSFGIQKFYSGKIGSGIACVIFSFTAIPAFIGIYDGIKGLTTEENSEGKIFIPS
jgi:TM2 domain-containing membrane protein YozV